MLSPFWRLATAAAVAAVVVWLALRREGPPPDPVAPLPSAVVLVTIDTLRADAVSYAGRHAHSTPFLDRLAANSLVYTHAYAPSSWTAPSMASLFTGLDPRSHGVVSGHIDKNPVPGQAQRAVQPMLAESLSTLAEHFQRAGYATIGTPANLHLAKSLGFAQGFDSYYGDARFLEAPDVNRQLFGQLRTLFGDRWQKTWKERPAFVWVHYFDPHIPYSARRPWIYRWVPDFERRRREFPAELDFDQLVARLGDVDAAEAEQLWPVYLSEVRHVDERLRVLHQRLDLADPNVLLIVTSDHGEELGEHGQIGHAVTLYEEVVRVPLLLHWPAGLPAPARIDTPVSLLDLFPTLAQLVGIEPPPVAHGQPLPMHPAAGAAERELLFHTRRGGNEVAALRQGKWKLIVNQGAASTQLFDLEQDAAEKANLLTQHADVGERLQKVLGRRSSELTPPPADAAHAEIDDPRVQERLRALGYQ